MEGISFIVRVRNEESTLEQCLRSLSPLKFPYEIIVILHMCTDGSRAIAERLRDEGMPIQIHVYGTPISRAGYETLVTDATSFHSMVYHSKWCHSRTDTYAWKFRWDSDFIATPSLIEYLNGTWWGKPSRPMRIYVLTNVSENHAFGEYYLSSGPLVFKKHLFWEQVDIDEPHDGIGSPPNVYIDHASKLENKKAYWDEPSWFLNDTGEEGSTVLRRYQALVALCGTEPSGHAGCGNPNSGDVEGRVYEKQLQLEAAGVRFWS
jgi:glycosyltransferase involved in cell wall biosynthesis